MALRSAPATRRRPPPHRRAPAAPVDEWDRYYSLDITNRDQRVRCCSRPTDGLIEDQTSIAVSADGKTFYYCTNAQGHRAAAHLGRAGRAAATPAQSHDRRRHRNVSGAARVRQVPRDAQRRLEHAAVARHLVGSATTATQKIVFPTSRPGFPMDAHVKPEIVITKAADGVEIHNQVFVPKDIKPGERRPGDRLRARRAGAADDARATTTCSSTTGPTASISGSPTRATS